jgi:hypothetical protein
MLQTTYAKKEDVPADKIGAYIEKDGKWVLDDLSNDHPVVAKRDELLTKTSTQQGQITRLSNEVATLKVTSVPEGHAIVPVADKQLLDAVKPLGTVEEIKTKLTEYPTLKEKEQSRTLDELYDKAAKELGYENVGAFKAIAKALKLDIKFKPEKVDGKDVEKPYVGDKALADHIAATPELKDAEPVFKTKPQVPAPSTEGGSGNRPAAAGAGGSTNGGGGDKTPTYRFQEPGDVKWD